MYFTPAGLVQSSSSFPLSGLLPGSQSSPPFPEPLLHLGLGVLLGSTLVAVGSGVCVGSTVAVGSGVEVGPAIGCVVGFGSLVSVGRIVLVLVGPTCVAVGVTPNSVAVEVDVGAGKLQTSTVTTTCIV